MPGNPESDAAALARLREQYPRWVFWRGQATGQWWACPPRGSACRALLGADSADTLASLVADVIAWEGTRR